MASYKVAQDVEADDKLVGPFGFRQFIYLIIVAMAGILGYGLWKLLPPLAILPLPIIVLFGALALPLRKDQPMETYLAAMVSYYLKPRKRLWKPDGVEQIVEITAPKTEEESLTKSFGGNEADRRLSYLADIADSRGWAIRHAAAPTASTSLTNEVYSEAQTAEDMLDDGGNLAQTIDSLIDKADAVRRKNVIESHYPPTSVYPPSTGTRPAGSASPNCSTGARPATAIYTNHGLCLNQNHKLHQHLFITIHTHRFTSLSYSLWALSLPQPTKPAPSPTPEPPTKH